MRPAIAPRDLGIYLAHVVFGRHQRDLARYLGINVSSVCRAIQRVERMRDCPAWDEIITQCEEFDWDPEARDFIFSPSALLSAIGTDLDVVSDLCHSLSALGDGYSVTTSPGLATAVIVDPRAKVVSHPARADVLGLVAFGLAEMIKGKNSQVQIFKLSKGHRIKSRKMVFASEKITPSLARGRVEKIFISNPNIFPPELFTTFWRIFDAVALHCVSQKEWDAIKSELPDDLARAVYKIMSGVGIEAVERDFNWPHRSAKLALSIAVQIIDQPPCDAS